jgi:hypothetical protein
MSMQVLFSKNECFASIASALELAGVIPLNIADIKPFFPRM